MKFERTMTINWQGNRDRVPESSIQARGSKDGNKDQELSLLVLVSYLFPSKILNTKLFLMRKK